MWRRSSGWPGERTPPPARRRGRSPAVAPVTARRKLLVYGLLLSLAFLYFVPFFWSVSTSLKTIPESVQGFDLIPDNPTLDAYRRGADGVQLRPLRREQRVHGDLGDGAQPLPVLAGRLRVRTPAVPGPRGAVHGRARDADDPRPASLRPGLPDPDRLPAHVVEPRLPAGALQPDRDVLGLHPDQRGAGDEPLLDAPVLPDDPEGLRRGREARRRRLLQDVLARDASARRPGARRRDDPDVPGDVERLLLVARDPPGPRTSTR